MGGDYAKEKRRLKRLEAQAGTTNPVSSAQPRQSPSNEQKRDPRSTLKENHTSFSGQSNSSSALLRLKRKFERKATGKFKTGNLPQTAPLESKQAKGKTVEPSNSIPSKRPKTNTPNQDSSNNRNKNKNPLPHKKHTKMETSDANKKPKHLKRKVEKLSMSLSSGSAIDSASGTDITQLEAQMKELAEQIEQFKRIKSSTLNTSKDSSRPDFDGDKNIPHSQTGNKQKKDAPSVKSSSSSESSDDSSSAPFEGDSTDPAKENKTLSSTASTSSSEDESSSSDEDAGKVLNTRSRGKRRRGRRNEDSSKENVKVDEERPLESKSEASEDKQTQISKSSICDAKTASKKKTPKKEDSRRCIGRKPVTDYVVGQKYSGKVKYIKSSLGAFIDIGSHSDAFCHISCISDEYATNVNDVLKVDDAVEARVVEVNREKKRITVSLRSEKMAQKEQDALKAKQSMQVGEKKRGEMSNHTRFETNDPEKFDNEERETVVQTKTNSESRTSENGTQAKLDSSVGQKSGADLKRERKLARRAERRAQKLTA
ncbi:hypothetical protein ACHAW6_009282 [Cyclotella cf. meneghiniana]